MADSNTRTEKRTPVTLKIKFKSETIEQFIERYAVDVSKGGIFVRTKDPLAVGTAMKFEFQLKDTTPLIGGEGTVVWTRENDPTRPNIAPGMGVRFDRLSDGSQTVLDRILSEKAKSGSARAAETKPPVYIDAPTRVGLPTADAFAEVPTRMGPAGGFIDAPTRVAQAGSADLIESSRPAKITRPAPLNSAASEFTGDRNEKTPLPSPMPFHSDADDFPEETFEEATKIRSLDELAQASLAGEAPTQSSQPKAPPAKPTTTPSKSSPALAVPAAAPARTMLGMTPAASASKSGAALDSVFTAETTPVPLQSPGPLAARAERPGRNTDAGALASDSGRIQPKLLDTSPSPRPEARGKSLSRAPGSITTSSAGSVTSNIAIPAVAPEPMPAGKKSGNGPALAIAGLAVAAAAAAAVWFLVLRDTSKPADPSTSKPALASGASGSDKPDTRPTNLGSGSNGSAEAAVAVGSNTPVNDGSGSAQPTVAAELVTTVVTAKGSKAVKIEVVGTDQKGPSPLSAKLEKGKTYTIRASAPGFKATEIEVIGGTATASADVVAKPRSVKVDSTPAGAAIAINGVATGKVTPSEIELKSRTGSVRIALRKAGFTATSILVPAASFTEDIDRMLATASSSLNVARSGTSNGNNNTGNSTGSNTGSGSDTGAGAGAGNGSDAGTGSGSDTTTPDVKPDVKPDDKPLTGSGAAGSGEPQPTWLK